MHFMIKEEKNFERYHEILEKVSNKILKSQIVNLYII